MSKTIEEVFLPLIREEVLKVKIELTKELTKELRSKVIKETYLTRAEAATYLKVSLTTIDNYCNNGLKKYKLGSSTRLKRLEIDEFVSSLNSFSRHQKNRK